MHMNFQESPKNAGEELKAVFKENKRLNCKARELLH